MSAKELSKISFARIICALLAAVFTLIQFTPISTAALSKEQLELFKSNVLYYDYDVASNQCNPDTETNIDVEPGKGSPTGTTFPSLDPEAMAEAINKYINKESPNSRMKGLGETIVAGAKNSNISPFLIVAIAQTESGIADPNYGDGFNVVRANNAFGRSATPSQPNVQGSKLWYKWTSIKASVDHTAPENNTTQAKRDGGDVAAYLRVKYPNELNAGDMRAFMTRYAPPNENDTNGYIQRNIDRIKKMAELTGSPPVSGATQEEPLSTRTSDGSTSLTDAKIYMLGDSITVGAKTELQNSFNSAQMDPYINGSVSRSILRKGTTEGFKTSGLEAVDGDPDKNKIKDSKVVVIALGTNADGNGSAETYSQNMKRLVEKIKSINANASIFTVNIFSPAIDKKAAYNQALDNLSSELNTKVIDVASKNIPTSDNIHPTVAGQKIFADTVVAAVSSSGIQVGNSSINTAACCAQSTTSTTPGRTNEEKVWNFLVSEMGLNDNQAAGIMGNIKQESGFRTDALNSSSGAYGLIQWYAGRKTKIQEYARSQNKPVNNIDVQLQFMKIELESSYKDSVLQPIKQSSTVAEATRIWLERYEVPCLPGSSQCDREMDVRLPFAQTFLGRYGSGQASNETASATVGDCTDPAASDNGAGGSSGQFSWPDDGRKDILTSCFGQRWGRHHTGLDIGSAPGTNVTAADGGIVQQAHDDGAGWGKVVIIKHQNNKYTLYGHNSSVSVKKGDKVDKGQVIAKVGNTGSSTGPHIHFNIQSLGGTSGLTRSTTEDPLKYLPKDGRPVSPSGSNCPRTSTLI